ncbi:MAG: type II toxin-antitoxin system ParD family antitoxin [Bacteroidota bacterium]
MGRNKLVFLGEHFDESINSEIESGRYKSAGEVIRSGLRLLKEEHRKINFINEALVIEEVSGKETKFDNEEFKLKMRKKLIKNT